MCAVNARRSALRAGTPSLCRIPFVPSEGSVSQGLSSLPSGLSWYSGQTDTPGSWAGPGSVLSFPSLFAFPSPDRLWAWVPALPRSSVSGPLAGGQGWPSPPEQCSRGWVLTGPALKQKRLRRQRSVGKLQKREKLMLSRTWRAPAETSAWREKATESQVTPSNLMVLVHRNNNNNNNDHSTAVDNNH